MRHFWKWPRARRAPVPTRKPKPRGSTYLNVEPLEDRAVPAIIWANQGSGGSDTDNFNAIYGANAAVARTIVSQAISNWNQVITNFNYANVGTPGNSPAANTYTLNVDAAVFGPGLRGTTSFDSIDTQGKPFAATVTIDDNGGGDGWYFDTRPGDDGEFDSLLTRFTATGTGLAGRDFYRTVAHEIGHALGIATDSRLNIADFFSNAGTDQVGSGSLRLYSNGGVTATLTTNGGGHLYEGPVDPAFPGAPTHPNDLLNPGRALAGGTTRELISDIDANILRTAYNYTITNPSQVRTFLATINGATGAIQVNPEPGVASNTVTESGSEFSFFGINFRSVTITANGATRTFTGVIGSTAPTSVNITGSAGNDTINVRSTPAGASTWIDGNGGFDTVNIGNAGSLAGVAGQVSVSPSSGSTSLTIDGSAESTADNVAVNSLSVTGFAPGTIFYGANVTSLRLLAGTGADTITVNSTSNASTTINTGGGSDTVNVLGTSGSLFVDSTGGADSVNIGNAGSLAGIAGQVSVSPSGGTASVRIDGSAENTNHSVGVSSIAVSGMAPASILYGSNVTSLSLYTGSGADTIDVSSTSSNATTFIDTGAGNDTVFVRTTANTLTLNNSGGLDSVRVGYRGAGVDGSMLGIAGTVNVSTSNSAATNLTLDARADPPVSFSVTSSSVTGLSPAPVNYFSGVSLNVLL